VQRAALLPGRPACTGERCARDCLLSGNYCTDAPASRQHYAPVRVLPHIRRLDDCFGQFLVRVIVTAARAARSSPTPWRASLAGQ
jgi:hypothetical protein